MNNWIGKRIGKCRIEKKLGAGGMATVFLAKHLLLDKLVALKVVHPNLLTEQDAEQIIERFLREARSAAKLDHPNIVPIYDVGQDQGTYYIVMQYIHGKSLEKVIEEQGRLTVCEALRITKEMAKGLQAAHNQGTIHRDIKPANVLITETQEVKITDFGMARQVYEDSHTEAGRAVGTPLYLAPEQAIGEKNLDGRADLYSLGATIYHALTGEPPYDGKTSFIIMQHHVYSPLPAIRTKFSYIPPEIEFFIHKLLAKKREDRFASAAEVISYIENLADVVFLQANSSPPHLDVVAFSQTKRRYLTPKGLHTDKGKNKSATSQVLPDRASKENIASPKNINVSSQQEIKTSVNSEYEGKIRIRLGENGVECIPIENVPPKLQSDLKHEKTRQYILSERKEELDIPCNFEENRQTTPSKLNQFEVKQHDNRALEPSYNQSPKSDDNIVINSELEKLPDIDPIVRQSWRKGLLSSTEWFFLIIFVIGCLILLGILYAK